MPISNEYIEFVKEQLEELGEIVVKRMFGGAGIYCNGLFFALIENDTLRFKVDDTNRSDFERRGMEPFRPFEGKTHTMQYYEVPAEILEDREELIEWARKSLRIALNSRKG